MIGMSGIPVTGSHTKKPLPKIQTPSTWLLYSLSTERKIEPPKPPVPVFLLFAMEKRPHILNTQPGMYHLCFHAHTYTYTLVSLSYTSSLMVQWFCFYILIHICRTFLILYIHKKLSYF